MEWLFVFILGIGVLGLLDDVHTKWHERMMVQPKHYKETIYV